MVLHCTIEYCSMFCQHAIQHLLQLSCCFQPYERCDFGRCYHRVKATAYGVGRFGADLVAESGEIGIGKCLCHYSVLEALLRLLVCPDSQLTIVMSQVKLHQGSMQKRRHIMKFSDLSNRTSSPSSFSLLASCVSLSTYQVWPKESALTMSAL